MQRVSGVGCRVSGQGVMELNPRVKLRQNGIVSFLIRLADFQARGCARVKLHLNISQSSLSTQSFFDCSLSALWALWEINWPKFLLCSNWPLRGPVAGL